MAVSDKCVLETDMLVPSKFLVLFDDVNWPTETWGMNLGLVVSNIRNRNDYAHKREDLEKIGFDYCSFQESGAEFPSEKECRKIFQDLYFQ